MKFSIKDFFSKCDQIRSFLRIWSHVPKKSLMENYLFCAVADSFTFDEEILKEKLNLSFIFNLNLDVLLFGCFGCLTK